MSQPSVNGSISNELISNCTNFQFSGLQSLADQFDDDEDAVTTENPFFEVNTVSKHCVQTLCLNTVSKHCVNSWQLGFKSASLLPLNEPV